MTKVLLVCSIIILSLGVHGLDNNLDLYRDLAQARLDKILKEKTINYEELYYELWIVQQTEGTWDSDDICQLLRNQEDTSKYQLSQAYFFVKSLKLNEGCDYSDIEVFQRIYQSKLKLPETAQTPPEEFFEFYFTTLLQIELKQQNHCNKIDLFIGKDGSGKLRRNKSDDNYRIGALLYELAVECINDTTDESQKQRLLKLIKTPIQTALINLQEIFKGARSVIEREYSLQSTSRLINAWLSVYDQIGNLDAELKQEYERSIFEKTIVNLLKDGLNTPYQSSAERYLVLKALKNVQLQEIAIPIVSDMVLFPQKVVQIQARFVNVLDNKVQIPDNVTGTLFRKDKIIQENVRFQQNSNKTKDFQGYFEVSSELLRALGTFQFVITVEGKTFSYQYERSIRMGTKFKIQEFNFAVVQGKGEKPDFDHYVEEKEVYPRVLKATEQSFLHVIFKLTYEKGVKINPQQVAIRLVHPEYSLATFLVNAQYDGKRDIYYGIVDFGDPVNIHQFFDYQEHILPHSGLYQVELVIGDQRLVECRRWMFASLDVTFSIPSNKPPPSDSDYLIQPIIQHQFQQTLPDVPLIFVSFFLGLMLIAFGFYLFMLKSIGVNTNKFPVEPVQQILVYIFLGLIFIVFFILVLFWVVFNLIETITILGVVLVPLFLVGNYALLSLRDKSKKE